ncbi:peptidoglycan bridge formation glycyltransferase FemA/FemB family protein [Arthrobacter sp. H5]|uniref:lipid II:glycine glycyltransferase FemX n=1 Tax=Arthrobacter sp. H5 TaxID=1267973 RepID=UPI000484F21D|nr:peptidoglycan bridge formation glycyltransferase FemA/FemB family protein [Arthrobacter sp. H5]
MTAALLHYRKLTLESFEELAAAHGSVVIPLEQSPYWADFEGSLGRDPYGIWAYYDADALVAVASFLRIQRRFRESMVVVNGPVWFHPRTPQMELRLMNTVRDQFGKDGSVNPLYVRMQIQNPQPPADGPLEHGWYEREIVVDLTPDEKAIFKSFRPNARNSIRRAERSGVDIRMIDRVDRVEVFRAELFPILEETAARDGFASFESGYYEKLLTELGDHLRLMVAYVDGKAVSWLITTEYRGHAVYYFAGSTQEARKTFAPYLLLWEAFKVLKAAGSHSCGLTGIVSENYPQLINVTTFKRNFSRKVVEVPTTYDIPLDPARYRAVAVVLRARRALPSGARKLLLGAASQASGLLRFRGRPRG